MYHHILDYWFDYHVELLINNNNFIEKMSSSSTGLISHASLEHELKERGYCGLNHVYNGKTHSLSLILFKCDPSDPDKAIDCELSFMGEVYFDTVYKKLSEEGKLFGMITKSSSHPGFYESRGPHHDIPYNPHKKY